MKRVPSRFFLLWLSVFLVSRMYVLYNPPYMMPNQERQIQGSGYSDVKQDYERYANMWHYGLTPYLKHWYEYPPAAIPLTYLPLWIDLHGFGYYYQNYRLQIFVLELLFFSLLIGFLQKIPMPYINRQISLGFYVLAGTIAKDFWYDGLDLVFMMSLVGAIMLGYLPGLHKTWKRIGYWILFWLSVAIKLLTLPLALPFLLASGRKVWKHELLACIAGFILIWGLPLMIFRSSLSVFLVFHGERPLKYEAFASFVVRTINDYTHTEIQSDVKPHFPMTGPVSTVAEQVTGIIFPLALLAVLLAFSYQFVKSL
jgi:hypothetical protein